MRDPAQGGCDIPAFQERHVSAVGKAGRRQLCSDGNVGAGVSRPIMRGKIRYATINGRRRIHRVVMDVGMFKGMGMIRPGSAKVHMAVGRVALRVVVVQHRAHSSGQQRRHGQQRKQLGSQVFQGAVQGAQPFALSASWRNRASSAPFSSILKLSTVGTASPVVPSTAPASTMPCTIADSDSADGSRF